MNKYITFENVQNFCSVKQNRYIYTPLYCPQTNKRGNYYQQNIIKPEIKKKKKVYPKKTIKLLKC